MITTRIEIDDTGAFPQNHRFRRVVVNWHKDHVLRTVTSSAIKDTAPPEEVVHVLRELAHRIERDCRGFPDLPKGPFESDTWARFVDDVNRIDRHLKDERSTAYVDSLYRPGPAAPLFEFYGYKVFRR